MTFCSTLFSDNVQSLLFEEVPVRVKRRHQLKKKKRCQRVARNFGSKCTWEGLTVSCNWFHRQQMKSKEKGKLAKLSLRRYEVHTYV